MSSALVWFRRDLRDFDHAALSRALQNHETVYCAFVFDRDILNRLENKADRRVEFIRESLVELDQALRSRGGALIVRHGRARQEIPALACDLGVTAVYANRDYEPDAIARDAAVAQELAGLGVAFHDFKDQVIFEKAEVLTGAGQPYSVFTPYKNAWLKRLRADDLRPWPVAEFAGRLACADLAQGVPELADIGFTPTNLGQLKILPGMVGGATLLQDFLDRMDRYHQSRDFPGSKGVSYLSPHLRFGTVSIRQLAGLAQARTLLPDGNGAQTWLNELVWRDFYHMILWHRPDVAQRAFKPEFDAVVWDSGPEADARFDAWCRGETGYPLVDAAMRQLNHSGWMHNRLRMVTASFLTKDLGLDWRRGEAYFAVQLLDFDLAANNGGWQWAASTGCDAQPWFRIFNPVTQSEKFDPQGRFIRRYLPQLAKLPDKLLHAPWTAPPLEQRLAGCQIGVDYPRPIVDHAVARDKTLTRFKAIKGS